MLFVIAYLAGIFTIATPCIFPILPFILARADQPFRRGGLPMLLGLAVTFAAVASLAAIAGNWAVNANHYGRIAALTLMTLFGLTMLVPALATRLTLPIVALGSRLSGWAGQRERRAGESPVSSLLIGIATGLVWAPCAGPVLGLILTGAALRGPGVETSLLLLAYGLGAATSLAGGILLGGRLLAIARRSARWGDRLRPILGGAVIAGVAVIGLGLDAGLLTRFSSTGTAIVESRLVAALEEGPVLGGVAYAAPSPVPTGPVGAVFGTRQWLNTPPLRPEALRGKVVLVNFWTYSCINCLRVLPHVRAWSEKYKDRGLVVIGVHTPEFAFEKDVANVQKATAQLGVRYPVAIDNDFAIWRAFGNRAWPALYFVGADGRVRHQAFGEGDYDQSERLIQQLLSEANGTRVAAPIVTTNGQGAQAEADRRNLGSGETYIGYAQAQNFASPGGAQEDLSSRYRAAPSLSLNHWSLDGVWTIGGEFATLGAKSGSIAHRFHARDLHLVLAPPKGRVVRFRVTIDGAAPGANHGADVDAAGWGQVREDRLYQLVRQQGAVADRTFRIEFFDAGVRAYAFTFG
jgi:cytochrome c biogenesis protein CcdA/thiol-disulfide isomerase/thioredoxin